jgi:hypothetical protein
MSGRLFRTVFMSVSMSRGFATITMGLPPMNAMPCAPALAKTWNSGSGSRMVSCRSVRMLCSHARSCMPASM